MKEPSLLMYDSSEKDGKIETMLDYVLSWTLRRAEQKYSNKNTLLYDYCKAILFKLLEIDSCDNIEIRSVETWKQWERIDLHANIELSIGDQTEWHAILIESKGYTRLHDNQLARCKDIFNEAYSTSPIKWNLHYALITCHEEEYRLDMYKKECCEHGFKLYSVSDLQNTEAKDTESDIFNEFWLRSWQKKAD